MNVRIRCTPCEDQSPHGQEGERWDAVETSMDGFWLIDLGGRLLEVNEAYVRRSGYSRAELLGMHVSDLEATESPSEAVAHVEKVFREGQDHFESLHRTKDGSLWPVEVSASYANVHGGRVFAFLRDITQRKEAERALRESEALNRRIIASSADCIKVLDLAGNLLSMNVGGQRLMEIDEVAPYLGSSWVDFWREPDKPAVRAAIDTARHGDTGQFEAYCPSVTGMPKWWDVVVTPIYGIGGKVERLLAVSRDKTERKLFEDTLQQAKAEAERANDAKSRFLAAAGHDLRQPFQAMRLFFEVTRPHVPPLAAPAFAKLDEAMRSGEELLSALLDVSLLEVGMVKVQIQPFSIADVLGGLIAECMPQALAKGLELRHVPSQAEVVSDPVLLARMLRNLLVNAVRYTERGRVLVGCRRRGRNLSIEVCDSGIGIAEPDIPRLFEEFYQVGNSERNKANGLGLGLAVVAKTARLLGHKISVRSTPGRGTVFSVLISGQAVR